MIGHDLSDADDIASATALTQWFCTRSSRDAFELLDRAAVPVEIVDENFCRTMFDDPAMIATGLIAKTTAPGIGSFEDPGLLIGFSQTAGVIRRGPCRCGQHTAEILRELGCSDVEIDDLVESSVVLDAPG